MCTVNVYVSLVVIIVLLVVIRNHRQTKEKFMRLYAPYPFKPNLIFPGHIADLKKGVRPGNSAQRARL